jgi:hypothetical protein
MQNRRCLIPVKFAAGVSRHPFLVGVSAGSPSQAPSDDRGGSSMPTGKPAAAIVLAFLTVVAAARPSGAAEEPGFVRIYGQKRMASIMVPEMCEYRATETGGNCLLPTSRHHALSFAVDDNVLGKALLREEIFPARSVAAIEAMLTDSSAQGARLWEKVIEQVFRDHLERDERPTSQSYAAVPKERMPPGAFACRGYRYEADFQALETGPPGRMRAGGMLCAISDRDELHMAIYEVDEFWWGTGQPVEGFWNLVDQALTTARMDPE